jgi:hypothetical protein
MPAFGDIFSYTEIETEKSEIFYYGLSDDLTYAVFDIYKGTIRIIDDYGECGREMVLTGSQPYILEPDQAIFGDLFSYTDVVIDYPIITYECDEFYATINIEDGSVRINGETFLLTRVF